MILQAIAFSRNKGGCSPMKLNDFELTIKTTLSMIQYFLEL